MSQSSNDEHAEDYRGFLLWLLREVWKGNTSGPYDIDTAAEKLEGNGLYFLFWSDYPNADDDKHQDQIYPLYVGITGRSFKQRFKEHIKDGVVHKIRNGLWPKAQGVVNLPLIVAYVVDMPLPVAKFFESVFLYSFDFAMNVEENGKKRDTLQFQHKWKVEDGISRFQNGYQYIKTWFNDIDKMVPSVNMEKTYNIFNYNF